MADSNAEMTITLTAHDIILAQREQKEMLAEPLRSAASLEDVFVDALKPADARHVLKTYAALARSALDRARMSLCERPRKD